MSSIPPPPTPIIDSFKKIEILGPKISIDFEYVTILFTISSIRLNLQKKRESHKIVLLKIDLISKEKGKLNPQISTSSKLLNCYTSH